MSNAANLEDLPPSAKLVYKVLEYEGPLSQKEIAEQTLLNERTVRYGLERLEEINVVTEDVHPDDQRQSLYSLNHQV